LYHEEGDVAQKTTSVGPDIKNKTFVKDFDKALSKYCLFDLFSAIKHKRKEIRRNRQWDLFIIRAFDLYINCRLERAIFKTVVYANLQPIKMFHDVDQPIRFPVHQMDGNPTV
jgi:hypothetical protein